MASRAQAKAKRVAGIRSDASALPVLRGQHRKRRPALLRFLLHSENSLTKPKAAILVPVSPKSSEAIEGSDYESTPSCPSFRAAGAQDGN